MGQPMSLVREEFGLLVLVLVALGLLTLGILELRWPRNRRRRQPARVRAALDAGLTESDLTAAVAATQRVFVHLGVHRVVAAH
jgi:hypothetical protein